MALVLATLLMVATIALNFAHWRTQGGQFLSWPTGRLRWLNHFLSIAIFVCCILGAVQLIPLTICIFATDGALILDHLYSIRQRHAHSRTNGRPAAI